MPAQAAAASYDVPSTLADFLAYYTPSTPEENLLIVHAQRAWRHLEQMHELIDAVTAGKGLFSLYTDEYARYKQLSRDLNQADRMWNRAINAFWQARRRGASTQPAPRPQPISPPAPSPDPTPRGQSHNPAPASSEHAQTHRPPLGSGLSSRDDHRPPAE